MRYPWTNLIILALVVLQAVTGFFGLTNGRVERAWILWLHGVGAYALIVIAYWKAVIIVDAWRRKSVWTGRRLAFIVLLVLLTSTLVTGLLWTFYGPQYVGGFSLISIHIYLAVPVMLLMAWHSWGMRFIWRVPRALGRRLFIDSAASVALGAFVWLAAGRARAWWQLPGERRRFTGSYEHNGEGTFPVVSWIADYPAPVAIESWRLGIGGVVDNPHHLTYEELLAAPAVDLEATLDCTGGWHTTQVWRGVSLGHLLGIGRPHPEAASVTVEAVSGYRRRFRLDQALTFVLAYDVGGRPLSHGHGFPLRLVAPGHRGVSWVKWVSRLIVNDTGAFWQLPLPLQ